MDGIKKTISIPTNNERAFLSFVDGFNDWWPREYTWSRNTLEKIYIDGRKNGLCTEIGPFNFRCDWGRVIDYQENEKLTISWQISPKREPIPDPDQASIITLEFERVAADITIVKFWHTDFDKHGDEGENYREMLDSEMGWDYILNCYKSYVSPSEV